MITTPLTTGYLVLKEPVREPILEEGQPNGCYTLMSSCPVCGRVNIFIEIPFPLDENEPLVVCANAQTIIFIEDVGAGSQTTVDEYCQHFRQLATVQTLHDEEAGKPVVIFKL